MIQMRQWAGLFAVLLGAMWLLAPLTATAEPSPTSTKGDANADGTISIVDAVTVFQYVNGTAALSTTEQQLVDVDENGAVTIADAVQLFQYVNGTASLPPLDAVVTTQTSENTTSTVTSTTASSTTTTDGMLPGDGTTTTATSFTLPSMTAIATTTATTVATAVWGIDVSEMQGEIDWSAVSQTEVRFAVLRLGYGDDEVEQDDIRFAENAAACEEYEIPYGAYIYSYAQTPEQAYSEALHTLRMLENTHITLPVFFDMEEFGDMTPAQYAELASIYCNVVAAAGYQVGVYANLYWWETKLTDPCFDQWYRWVAQYNDTCDYDGVYHLWQYGDGETVSGITQNTVDVNWCYMDLSVFGVTVPSESTTTTTTTTTTSVSTLRPTQATGLKVMRVSGRQGEVDWAAVAASDVDYVILRLGYGDDEVEQDDSRWLENALACEQYGIPYGADFFCYARTAEDAVSEAQHALRLLESRTLSLPLFYEMGYSNWQGDLTSDQYAAIATVFCDTLGQAGYTVGVQANLTWWNDRLTDPCFDRWYRCVMQYNETCDYTGTYHLWQYTDAGTVDGVNGTICCDLSYVDFLLKEP